MKILDFDLEGSHFIIEADISPRQEADDMECQWLRYDFDNTQVYKETDGVVSPFQITAVAWAGYQLTADHALKDVIGRISRNETGKLTVHYVCYIFERGYLPTKHLQNRYQRPLRER